MAISAMKTWVSRCQSHHSCGAGNDVNLPTRVIDLKPMDEGRNPLLFETAGQRGVYIALSYCWGDNQEFKNTNSNYHEFRTNGIEHSKLAQTLKDAIQITRLLGVRYIWIDAICIIQSMEGQSEIGNEDFNREGLRMQDYYGNSLLTSLLAPPQIAIMGSLRQDEVGFKTHCLPFPSSTLGMMVSKPDTFTLSFIHHTKSGHLNDVLGRSKKISSVHAFLYLEKIRWAIGVEWERCGKTVHQI